MYQAMLDQLAKPRAAAPIGNEPVDPANLYDHHRANVAFQHRHHHQQQHQQQQHHQRACSPRVSADEDEAYTFDSQLMATLLSEDHIGLDTALLREMEELLDESRASEQENEPLAFHHLDSPSASTAAAAGSQVSHSFQQVHSHDHGLFRPQGAGWQVHESSSSNGSVAPQAHEEGETAEEEDEPMEVDQNGAATAATTLERELLARQVKFLEAQRDFLEFQENVVATGAAGSSSSQQQLHMSHLRHHARQEQQQLHAAQLHQQLLTNATRQQQESFHYMEQLLLQSPLNHYRMTLMTPMESYIHLTKDPLERRHLLTSLRDTKIDAVRHFIDFQARNIEPERQFFYLDTFEKFGKYYTVDFSISKLDDTTVEEVVNVLYNHFVGTNDAISQILGSVENREYFDGINWEFMNARFVDRINLPKRKLNDRGFVVQESNTVYYIKKFGDRVVLMSDFIDKDDLHPYRVSGRIRKDVTVGVIVEPLVDAQGHACVIMKRFSFVKHHFKTIRPTPDLVQAISTKVILWGQAVRFCLAGRKTKPRADGQHTPSFAPQLVARAEEITEATASAAVSMAR